MELPVYIRITTICENMLKLYLDTGEYLAAMLLNEDSKIVLNYYITEETDEYLYHKGINSIHYSGRLTELQGELSLIKSKPFGFVYNPSWTLYLDMSFSFKEFESLFTDVPYFIFNSNRCGITDLQAQLPDGKLKLKSTDTGVLAELTGVYSHSHMDALLDTPNLKCMKLYLDDLFLYSNIHLVDLVKLKDKGVELYFYYDLKYLCAGVSGSDKALFNWLVPAVIGTLLLGSVFIADDSFDYVGLDMDDSDHYFYMTGEIEESLEVQPKPSYIELNGNIHGVIHKLYALRYTKEGDSREREIVDDIWVDEQIMKSLSLLASAANKGGVSEDVI